jgi:DNA-binding response OmpR family regulator
VCAPAERERVAPAGRARVLVVDDNALLRQLVCEALEDDGFAAAGAADVATALQQAAAAPLGVILLDLHLGAESGEAFVPRYRALPAPHAPIVLFTASSAREAAAEVARLGAAGFLSKPFDLEQLVALVARLAGSPN